MDNRHLPYNILLVIMIVSVTLMAMSSLLLRRSSFAVTVGYAIPRPVPPPVSSVPPPEMPEYLNPPENNQEQPSEQFYTEEPDDTIRAVQFPLELNRATYGELLFIPGVGDVTAQRILQYRSHIGGYTDLSQLTGIYGIGDATFLRISAYLYLEDEYEADTPDDDQDETDDDNFDFYNYQEYDG